jgi:hypothetical protein
MRQTAELIHDSQNLQPFYAAMGRGAWCRQSREGRETLVGFLELTFSSSCKFYYAVSADVEIQLRRLAQISVP